MTEQLTLDLPPSRTTTQISARQQVDTITALDLFAGTGWGVACDRLGILEKGVEIMPEAVATRAANGMDTVYCDVWDGLLRTEQIPWLVQFLASGGTLRGAYTLLIASPPCQTFSVAGSGGGRKALNEVLEAIHASAWKDPAELIAFGKRHDMRTALVLAPLSYIWRDRPRYVVLEQVPSVLPVWEAYAIIMRSLGYSVKTAVLNSEQYGVPQTRKRAILVANLEGKANLPEPTHSRYYPHNPAKQDAGVLGWVSMAEALGWDGPRMVDSSQSTVGVDAKSGRVLHYPKILRSNYGTGGDPDARGERTIDQPASCLTSKAGSMKWDGERRLSVQEGAILQTYPSNFTWMGRPFLQIGNAVPPLLGQRILEAVLSS